MAQDMPTAPHHLSEQAITKGIERLQECIAELEAFDLSTCHDGSTAELRGLEVRVRDTLMRCFGENSSTYKDLQSAATLCVYRAVIRSNTHRPDYIARIQRNVERAIALLHQGQRSLREDLADYVNREGTVSMTRQDAVEPMSRRVFVVHGHDDGSREMVARFLERLGFEAIILHEQANGGRTVIEKVEAHGDVSFAVVLLTPDDEGCVKGGTLLPRARQNVILELGYFIGRLGRGKVCALKRGQIEIPSDYAGVVYESLDGHWKQALGRELETAGHAIDWNVAMRA
ncbi:nucleotide-binding protein [Pseudomonas guariconensis]|uniref:TIR domain-containing protein n=1 Tax=Pseudomonas guariconensis TaxID=1288410 RepID=UPI0018AB3E4A|nr:nucleotide-binding protein [Pseudomonas guariconensis]MBF8733124.1 nucleotide-binding protein [Pseudomonas guariconensis]